MYASLFAILILGCGLCHAPRRIRTYPTPKYGGSLVVTDAGTTAGMDEPVRLPSSYG
jgi:hypothetical protein